MKSLLAGYSRFKETVFPQKAALFQTLKARQTPEVLLITCADSRISPNLITQTEPGDLFLCRNAGNIVPPHGESSGGVEATVEYAVAALGVRDIIICGHSDCGAMRGVLHPEKLTGMPSVGKWLSHTAAARAALDQNYAGLTEEDALRVLTEENVVAQLNHLRTHPAVAARLASGKLQLHGWVYQIETAEIRALDAEKWQFVPLGRGAAAASLPRPLFELAS